MAKELSLKEIFSQSITKAFNLATKDIVSPEAKAKVYTDIAMAIANYDESFTGVLASTDEKANIPKKEDLEVRPSKNDEENNVEANEEVVEDFGNPDVAKKYEDELKFVELMVNADKEMDTTYFIDMVKEFSSNQITELEEITPANITAIVTYVKEQMAKMKEFINALLESNGEETVIAIIGASYEGFESLEQIVDTNLIPVYMILNQAVSQSEE